MATFGNVNVGVEQTKGAIENRIFGSVFTCPQNGEANSITAHILVTDVTTKVKCAIYRADNYALVGVTEERQITRDTTFVGRWETFNFTVIKPQLVGGVQYLLVAWSEDQAGSAAYLNNTSITVYQSVQMELAYGTFPSTFVPTRDPGVPADTPTGFYMRVASIYCYYTPTAPPVKGTLEVHAYA